MATKRNGNDCFDKAGIDEPIFTLRAQDFLADKTVDFWALLMEVGGGPASKIEEARACARAMRNWPSRKMPD